MNALFCPHVSDGTDLSEVIDVHELKDNTSQNAARIVAVALDQQVRNSLPNPNAQVFRIKGLDGTTLVVCRAVSCGS